MNEAKVFRLILAISLVGAVVVGGFSIYLDHHLGWLSEAEGNARNLYEKFTCARPPIDCTASAVQYHQDVNDWHAAVEATQAELELAELWAWLPGAVLLPLFYAVRFALTGRIRPLFPVKLKA